MDVHIGKKIRERRDMLELTPQQLAQKCAVTKQRIDEWEAGTVRLGAAKLYELSLVLGVSIGYFFEDYEG